jgi:hypothetical protein
MLTCVHCNAERARAGLNGLFCSGLCAILWAINNARRSPAAEVSE